VKRYLKNDGHKWARLYRRVRAATMVDPLLAAEYDPDRNIVFINSEVFEQLTPEQQREVYRPSTFQPVEKYLR
jgi:hypothetical protein